MERDEYETPKWLVKECLKKLAAVVEHRALLRFNEQSILDPCTGIGAWFKELGKFRNSNGLSPTTLHYCEIREGLDFYKCTDNYNIIVGNPPFSQLTKWLNWSIHRSNGFIAYLLPASALNHNRLSMMEDYGFYLTAIHSLPNPKEWNLGFAHFFCIWTNEYSTDVLETIMKKEGVQTFLEDYL